MSSTSAAHALGAARPSSAAVVDAGLGAAAFGGALALGLALVPRGAGGIVHPGSEAHDLVGLALVALSAVPLVVWRRAPLGVFALTATASTLLAGLGYPIGLPIGATAALYLLAASRDEASPWTGLATTVVVGFLLAYLAATAAAEGGFPGIELLHTGLAWTAAWFAGERARLRRQQVAVLQDRAGRVEREAERERLLAVAEERARIARDLHDSAGHAINVIAVRAGAARLRHDRDPDRSLAALEAIEDLARQTVEEIDHLVGVLRDGGSEATAVESPPALASLDTLIAQHEAAGLAVTLDTVGVSRPLPGGAEQAAFRVLQEALTNAARHGDGTARVVLGFGDAALAITVTNPLPPGSSPRASGGHGLVGMRERATLLGGELTAAPSGEVFCIRARLPYGTHGA